jgi:hypothetical protein
MTWKLQSTIHDEIQYEWRPTMDDVVWARDSNDVVHVWYKINAADGVSGCGIDRKDIQQFSIREMEVTCLGCLATVGDVPEGMVTALMQQLQKSLQAPAPTLGEYSPEDIKATLEFAKKLQDIENKAGYVPTFLGRQRKFRNDK